MTKRRSLILAEDLGQPDGPEAVDSDVQQSVQTTKQPQGLILAEDLGQPDGPEAVDSDVRHTKQAKGLILAEDLGKPDDAKPQSDTP